jgi:hypothetical protein
VTRTELEPYRAAMKAAKTRFDTVKTRLTEIASEQMVLSGELVKLRRTITALAAMCSEPGTGDFLGITASIEEVMSETTSELTTAEVVKALEEVGFDLSAHRNGAASVHAILTRLAKVEKIKRIENHGNISWRGPKYDPHNIPF